MTSCSPATRSSFPRGTFNDRFWTFRARCRWCRTTRRVSGARDDSDPARSGVRTHARGRALARLRSPGLQAAMGSVDDVCARPAGRDRSDLHDHAGLRGTDSHPDRVERPEHRLLQGSDRPGTGAERLLPDPVQHPAKPNVSKRHDRGFATLEQPALERP
jgi:hypothetical protein